MCLRGKTSVIKMLFQSIMRLSISARLMHYLEALIEVFLNCLPPFTDFLFRGLLCSARLGSLRCETRRIPFRDITLLIDFQHSPPMLSQRSFNPKIASMVWRGVSVWPGYFLESFMQYPFSGNEMEHIKFVHIWSFSFGDVFKVRLFIRDKFIESSAANLRLLLCIQR